MCLMSKIKGQTIVLVDIRKHFQDKRNINSNFTSDLFLDN